MKTLSVDIGGTWIKWAVLPSRVDAAAAASTLVDRTRTLGWLNSTLADAFDSSNPAAITHPARELEPYDRVAVSLCGEFNSQGRLVSGNLAHRGVPADLAEGIRNNVAPASVRLINDAEAWTRGASDCCNAGGPP